MNATSTKLKYEVCENKKTGLPVIIVAAGSSSRMQGIDKMFLEVAGVPVIARTLSAFERSPDISKIILVTREESVNKMQLIAEKYMITKLSDIVTGADTRHGSVIRGLERLAAEEDKALVSDGARMFVTPRMISDCAQALAVHDGCLCAVKVSDTVKKVENGKVAATLDRSPLYLAQTPQGITVSLYRKAAAESDAADFTDDAAVLEAGGYDVIVVDGDLTNIKITTPQDIALAEAYLRRGNL